MIMKRVNIVLIFFFIYYNKIVNQLLDKIINIYNKLLKYYNLAINENDFQIKV